MVKLVIITITYGGLARARALALGSRLVGSGGGGRGRTQCGLGSRTGVMLGPVTER